MTEHTLKTWPEPFAAVLSGDKRAEVRKADRDYKVGDVLVLREWDAEKAQALYLELGARYQEQAEGDFMGALQAAAADATQAAYTGRECRRRITHILRGGQFGIERGYVVLSLGEVEP